jgi:surface antigen
VRSYCFLAASALSLLTACASPYAHYGTPTPLTCVPYARETSGIQLSGDAWTWWFEAAGRYPRAQTPEPGAILVFKPHGDMTSGHLAVVTALTSPREIEVTQSNWLPHRIEHNQPIIDVSENNDWTAVRVWYEPTHMIGSTIYPTYGFILPQ